MGNLNREMKTIKRINKILEMKSTNYKMKNSLDRLSSILETIEKRVNGYEDRSREIFQSGKQRGKMNIDLLICRTMSHS